MLNNKPCHTPLKSHQFKNDHKKPTYLIQSRETHRIQLKGDEHERKYEMNKIMGNWYGHKYEMNKIMTIEVLLDLDRKNMSQQGLPTWVQVVQTIPRRTNVSSLSSFVSSCTKLQCRSSAVQITGMDLERNQRTIQNWPLGIPSHSQLVLLCCHQEDGLSSPEWNGNYIMGPAARICSVSFASPPTL